MVLLAPQLKILVFFAQPLKIAVSNRKKIALNYF